MTHTPSPSITLFNSLVQETLTTCSTADLATPDKVKGRKIQVPGVYDVIAKGCEQRTGKNSGKPYFAIDLEDPVSGQTIMMMPQLFQYGTGAPNLWAMQCLLTPFGFKMSQAQVALFWKGLIDMLPYICVGHCQIQLSYEGFTVDYRERNCFGIRDWSKEMAHKYPDNWYIDPVNGDSFYFQSREEGLSWLAAGGNRPDQMPMKGKEKLVFIQKVHPAFEYTPDQEELKQSFDAITAKAEGRAVELAKPAEPPAPAPRKPAWKPGIVT